MSEINAEALRLNQVPVKTPSCSSLSKLAKEKDVVVADDIKITDMDAKIDTVLDSKIAAANLNTINSDDSALDYGTHVDPLYGLQSTLNKNMQAIKKQQDNHDTMQAQINMVTDQLDQLLLANKVLLQYLSTTSNHPPSGDDKDKYDSYIDDDYGDDDKEDEDYEDDRTEDIASVGNPNSYENSPIVLGQGDTCLWKAKSICFIRQ